MGNYSKAFGALAGSVIGVLLAFGITVPEQWVTIINAVVPVLGSVVGAFVAPANKTA